MLWPARRRQVSAVLLGLVLVLLAGLVVGAGPPAAAQDPDLPGYDPWATFTGTPRAYTYETAEELLQIPADSPKLDVRYLEDLDDHSEYEPGTENHLLTAWRDYKDGGGKWGWVRYRNNYVRLHDGALRGRAFAELILREEAIRPEDGWVIDAKIPGTSGNRRADAFNLPAGWVFEFKSGSEIVADQLAAYVVSANERGVRVAYFFGMMPSAKALAAIERANLATDVNRARLAAGQDPVPVIVARFWPALAQPLRPGSDGPAGPAGGVARPTAPTGPSRGGGGGQAGTPTAGDQLPVTGSVTDAIEWSADSAEDAAEMARVNALLAAELGEDAAPTPPGGIDFSTLELRYLADTYMGGPGMAYGYRVELTGDSEPSFGGRRAARLASDSFFTWLALPPSRFTVNLHPEEPDRIIDDDLGRTDAGRVLLEADLRMKRTVAQLIHPDTKLGAEFWGVLRGSGQCLSMRQWIVPAPATVHETGNALYILDAPLTVKMESEYLGASGPAGPAGPGGACRDPGGSAVGGSTEDYNEDLYRGMILPKVEEAVNHAPEYADLRRVYVSRVAAEWYRERSVGKHTAYADLIDSGDISRWVSEDRWSPRDVFRRFVRSYTRGEFNLRRTTRRGSFEETTTYVFGGVDFTEVPRKTVSAAEFSGARPTLPATVEASVFGQLEDQSGEDVWLGGMSTSRPLAAYLAEKSRSPASSGAFWALLLAPAAVWLGSGAVLLARWQRRRRPGPAAPTSTPTPTPTPTPSPPTVGSAR